VPLVEFCKVTQKFCYSTVHTKIPQKHYKHRLWIDTGDQTGWQITFYYSNV
jgi:translation initiation factor IF-1